MDNVESYFQMLMAEMETLSLVPEGGSNPSIKALQQVASGPPQRVTTTETFAGRVPFLGLRARMQTRKKLPILSSSSTR